MGLEKKMKSSKTVVFERYRNKSGDISFFDKLKGQLDSFSKTCYEYLQQIMPGWSRLHLTKIAWLSVKYLTL